MSSVWGGVRGFVLLTSAVLLTASTAARAGGLICPGSCVGGTNHGARCFAPADCPGAGAVCQILDRCIYVEWRPSQVIVPQGSVAEVNLWIYSSDGFTIPLEGSDIILNWDATRLELLGKRDPCLTCAGGTNSGTTCQSDAECPGSTCAAPGLCFDACPAQTYNWFASFFPNDCAGDALNAPCTGLPANDGDARYENLKQIACGPDPGPSAMVTPLGDGTGGLHVTTFLFQPLIAAGGATVDVPIQQANTKTAFLGGSVPGLNLLGLIANPVQIIVADICDPPTAAAAGGRYIDITPAAGTQPVALLVSGSSTNPDVACVAQYVNMFCRGGVSVGQPCQRDSDCGTGTCSDARLGATAQNRLPSEWGTISVSGAEIEPGTLYTVQSDCGAVPGDLLSNPVNVTTWMWGDTVFNNNVNFQDISKTVDAFKGAVGVRIENTDLFGSGASSCTPNFLVNFVDITANVVAFQGASFRSACAAPCP